MAVIESFEEVRGDAPAPPPDRRRPRPVRLVIGVVVAALVVVGLGFLVTEPEPFDDRGTGSSMSLEGQPPGIEVHFGIHDGDLPDVTVTGARVVLADGSAAVATSVSICELRPEREVGAFSGAVGDLAESCSTVRPVTGQDLGDLGADANLVMTLVPLAPGRIETTAVDLSFDQGIRSGTQRLVATHTIEG